MCKGVRTVRKKIGVSEGIFQACMVLLFIIVAFVCFYPFWYIFIVSISDPAESMKQTVSWLPIKPTIDNYIQIFNLKGIYSSFLVSCARTVVGTAISLFFTSILAYTLTRQELPMRKFFYRFVVVSMYIGAGLIPWYLTMRSLGLKDSFLVYVIPGAVSAYNMILIKTYIESVPPALAESAMIDGAGHFRIYSTIIMPVCVPILAAVIVFTAIGQWNSWQDNLLLVNDNNLKTLQLTLLEYLRKSMNAAQEAQQGGFISGSTVIAPMTVRMTITMVVTLPILLVYPFMQKYFISGIMIGSIKG